MPKILWSTILQNWENGIPHKYPKQLKGRFLWNTSVLKNNGNSEFKQIFRTNLELPAEQNKTDFEEYIKKSTNKYVTSFLNLSKDTMLVIPMPYQSKNYATFRDFTDNASPIQQQEFWKHISLATKDFMKKHDKVWISTHGFGVPYLHVRISTSPKYYFANELKKT
jgi:hypothetical protein